LFFRHDIIKNLRKNTTFSQMCYRVLLKKLNAWKFLLFLQWIRISILIKYFLLIILIIIYQ